eukprot:TRINITY_DN13455_c0_g1_i1.p1 TRINITY_DN13455_c0_g1~~TRINITY_DN13455_c0_g1_i1.p1  ORF type:complete len:178 (+),score=34.75 TRINITY_DN13455_c0_g1_i1:142-675(+)
MAGTTAAVTPAVTLVARTGRHHQRYQDGFRLVAGCIPWRCRDDRQVEVLMISSQHGNGLLFPKGGWETDESAEEAACREAMEEAGVRGIIQEKVGVWDFKSKRQRNELCRDGDCRAYIFALAVTEQLEVWPEQHARRRQWFLLEEALDVCRHEWMRNALKQWASSRASVSHITGPAL